MSLQDTPNSQDAPSSQDTPVQADSEENRRLLYCHCAYSRVVPKGVKAEVLKGLAESGRAFDAVPDLCELAARCDPSLKKLADPGQGPVDIVACYPRAVRWLFHAADSPLPEDDDIRIHNMRTDSAGSVLYDIGLAEAPPEAEPDAALTEGSPKIAEGSPQTAEGSRMTPKEASP